MADTNVTEVLIGNIKGPKGDQGSTGPQGATGPQGPAGQDGTNGQGVPTGGAFGNILRKKNGTDYQTEWVSPVNNLNQVDEGGVLDARQGKVLNDSIGNVADGLGILANGNTHAAIASDQAVFVRNHSSLADGLYWAKTAISANGALSTSNLTADSAGGLNTLKADIDSSIATGDYSGTLTEIQTALVNLNSTLNNYQFKNIRCSFTVSEGEFVNASYYGTIMRHSASRFVVNLTSASNDSSYKNEFVTGFYNNGAWSWKSLALNSNISKHIVGARISILGYTSTPYYAPSDGYAYLINEEQQTDVVFIGESQNVSIGSTPGRYCTFVRKGTALACKYGNASVACFCPLG